MIMKQHQSRSSSEFDPSYRECSAFTLHKMYEEEFGDIHLTKHLGRSLPQVSSLTDVIRELNSIFDNDEINIELVRYVMKSYKSNPADWKKFAKFDRFR